MNEEMPEAVQSEDSYFDSLPVANMRRQICSPGNPMPKGAASDSEDMRLILLGVDYDNLVRDAMLWRKYKVTIHEILSSISMYNTSPDRGRNVTTIVQMRDLAKRGLSILDYITPPKP